MILARALTVFLIGATAGNTSRLAIRVSPVAFMAGADVVVTCSVVRDPANRSIEAALLPYSSSERPLNGDQAPITNRFEFRHVPCEVEIATCRLHAQAHRDEIVEQPLLVGGCSSRE